MNPRADSSEPRPIPEPREGDALSVARLRESSRGLKGHFRPRLFLGIYLPPAILLLVFYLISLKTNVPFSTFTKDPGEITHSSPFNGVLSNIGVLFWCSSAAISILSFLLLRKDPEQKKISQFFLVSSVVTIILMLDDLFMFHEEVYPHVFHFRQRYIYLAYFLMILIFLWSFRRIILNSEYMPLVFAFLLFGVSIVVDGIADRIHDIPLHYMFEDGTKFLGIAGWLGYFGKFSWQKLSERLERAP